jgi:hypothetical protein
MQSCLLHSLLSTKIVHASLILYMSSGLLIIYS